MRPLALSLALLVAAPLAAAFDPTTFAVAPPFDPFGEGLSPADAALFPGGSIVRAHGGAFFGDGSLLVAYQDRHAHVAADLSTIHSVVWMEVVSVAEHPDGEAVVLNYNDDTVYKYGSSGGALIESASDPSGCVSPSRAVVQRTGNQRIFVMCVGGSNGICQYDSDLGNRACTAQGLTKGLAMAPDDSFLLTRDFDTLRKYTINDGAGTLTAGATLDISGSTTSTAYSLVVLSDNRIVVVDPDNDELEVVNAAFDTVNTIAVNGGTLGGITPGCDSPEEVAVDPAGAGDVVVGCDVSGTLLILSNDLSTTAVDIATPSDLGLVGSAFSLGIGASVGLLNVADSGSKVFLGGQNDFGFAFLDLTGGGTAGMAGSYSTPALTPARSMSSYASGTRGVLGIDSAVGAVVFSDNTVAVAIQSHVSKLTADYSTILDSVDGFSAISQMIPHPDNTAIVLDFGVDTIYKETSGLALSAFDSDAACSGPSRAVVQQTGNQRIFVMCVNSPHTLCQYDSDLSGRTCTTTTTTSPEGLGIAPDDSFLVIRDHDTLRKYTINDGAGTLTAGDTLDISGSTTSSVFSLTVLSDHRIVVPDRNSNQLEVVNAAFDTVTTINVNSGSLGGITPSCSGPEEVATSFAGTGDVVVACDSSNSVLVLSNDLSTTAFEPTIEFYAMGVSLSIVASNAQSALSVADTAGTTMFVSSDDGIVLLDLTGAGTSGLVGSYATPLLAVYDVWRNGVMLGSGSRTPPSHYPVGAVDFGDGSMAVAMSGLVDRLLLVSSDFSTVLDSLAVNWPAHLIAHPDNSAILLDPDTDTIYKYTSDGSSLTLAASDSNIGECNNPARAVVQQTGNQRIFVTCTNSPDAFCQYDSDLSGRSCTALVSPYCHGIAPDDSFVVVRSNDILRKFTINDGAGTLTEVDTLDISGTTTTNSLAVLSDFRILIPDSSSDQLHVVNTAFDTVTSIDVNSGSLGGITPSCIAPAEVATDSTGAGDVVLACDGSDDLLVLSNDLSTTAQMVGADEFGDILAPEFSPSLFKPVLQFMPSGELFVGGNNFVRITGTPPVGAGGDPIVTDLAGHKFVVGTDPLTQYSLLRSPDGVDEVLFRTSDARGRHGDYFIDTITVVREGCGSATVRALPTARDVEVVGETSACMDARMLRGDTGITVASIGDGSAAVVIVPHHQSDKAFSFLNIKIAGEVGKLRKEGWQGVLGDEAHAL